MTISTRGIGRFMYCTLSTTLSLYYEQASIVPAAFVSLRMKYDVEHSRMAWGLRKFVVATMHGLVNEFGPFDSMITVTINVQLARFTKSSHLLHPPFAH